MSDRPSASEDTATVTDQLPPIPAKRYFAIGEVSELCAVKPHVLRYWEREFKQLHPVKRRGNRRYYQPRDVIMVRRIRELLYDQGFTIEQPRTDGLPGIMEEERRRIAYGGARQLLADLRGTGAARPLAGDQRLTPGGLKNAVRQFDAEHGGAATWHILYGRLGSLG